MTSKPVLIALLAIWGGAGALPAFAEGTAPEVRSDRPPSIRGLMDRVWVKSDSGDRPDVIKIFLSDGTLFQDSCWETHRLSQWRAISDSGVGWNEDGQDIAAEIVSVSAADLVLKLDLKGGPVQENYTAAVVPYVCPDIPK